MAETRVRNLIIAGNGSINGGDVHLAKIEGTGTVTGDINCSIFTVNGKADIYGSVRAKSAQINGSVTMEGDLIADTIQLNGMAKVIGKCEAEKLKATGRLNIDTLNAGKINITLHGSSHITEIGGEHIDIRKQSGIVLTTILKAFSVLPFDKLTAQIIEGDSIYVEYTIAEVVRGTNVVIGPGCEINLVEYKTKLEQDKSSNIKRIVQR
jgi:cytoskeletal protein CcmA (bactofilin family)